MLKAITYLLHNGLVSKYNKQAYNKVCEFKKNKCIIFNPKLIDLTMGRSIRNLRTELVTVAIV